MRKRQMGTRVRGNEKGKSDGESGRQRKEEGGEEGGEVEEVSGRRESAKKEEKWRR